MVRPEMSPAPLRARLAEQTTFGLWVTLESPTVTEIAAELGLDWICVDMEHGALGYPDLLAHLRAARGSGTSVLARVPALTRSSIKRALDLGAHGVLVPLVGSAVEVREANDLAMYPPDGTRSIGGERAVQWGLRTDEYLAGANERVLVVPIVETAPAVADLDAILQACSAAVFVGPADLAASLGNVGEWGGAAAEFLRELPARSARHGIACGIIAREPDEAAARISQGYRMVALGSDTAMLIRELSGVLAFARTAAGQ